MHIMVPVAACPASMALQAEGLAHHVEFMYGAKDYRAAFIEQWRKGEGFIILEHDVVPWPGALEQLMLCPEDFCGYRYPLGRAGKLGGTLGCIKFSEALIAAHPDLPSNLGDPSWGELDGQVFAALGREDFHVHWPAVAHLKEMVA